MTIEFPEQKERFDEKIKLLRSTQGKNVKFFNDSEYNEYIEMLHEIRKALY